MNTNKPTGEYDRTLNAIVATDAVLFGIINNELHVLLIQLNKKELKGQWAFPGGLVRHKESLNNCISRILLEKTGLKNVFTDQLATFGEPNRDMFGHVVSVAYLALVDVSRQALKTTAEYDDIKWFPINKLPILAYDHKEMFAVARERLKAKIEYTNIAQGILNQEFTLSELQAIYELVLGKELDKRNFRKKILKSEMLKETGNTVSGQQSRPAALYSFSNKEIKQYDVI